jgi:hypothetical protein
MADFGSDSRSAAGFHIILNNGRCSANRSDFETDGEAVVA